MSDDKIETNEINEQIIQEPVEIVAPVESAFVETLETKGDTDIVSVVDFPKIEVEAPKVEKIEKDKNEDIFITENDLFDITVRWYNKNGNVVVEGVDEDFDYSNVNEFTVTLKYPSQGDYEIIMGSTAYRSPDEMKIIDIIQMELTRLVTLMRKWSLKQDISRMVQLDPNIIKGMTKKVRDIIGMKGIL